MSVYHFEQGKLVKLADDVAELLGGEDSDNADQGYLDAGWAVSEEVEGAYVAFSPAGMKDRATPLQNYAYAFQLEDFTSSLPWAIWVRDDPAEYLEVMRLMQPLFSRLQHQMMELEHEQRQRAEGRADWNPAPL